MKVIIAGSRSITSLADVRKAVRNSRFEITEVVSGCARGADLLGEKVADELGVPVTRFPARWRDKDGEVDRQAGFKRNVEMAEYADALVAVWDGRSNGTYHMAKTMRDMGKPLFVMLAGPL